jgi:hypothetical protein
MVCFPNIQKSGLPPLPELSPKLIIDCDDLARLAESLTTGSQFFYREHGSVTLSQADCRAIADALKPVFEVPSRWSSHIFEQRFEIERLTAEQQSAFEMFKHNTRISLSGPAGSGKTVVAAHVARQVVRRRQTVLVVVPTKPLRQFYRSIICSDLAAVVLPDAAASALTRRFDLVLIDEAQDAPPDLWHSIRAYCDDVSAALLVVHDSNQRLATQWSEIFGRFAQATFTKVLRSTSQIGELAGRFYLNSRLPAEIAGPTGEPVKEIAIATSTDIPIAVSKFIKDLVQRESFSFRDFIVLFGKSNGTFLRAGGQTIGGLKFRNAAEVWGEGCDDALCIACGGITTFRGMESPVVVLCEVDNLLDEQLIEGCYVGISRAQHVLAIVGLPGTLDRIRSIDLGPVAAERRKHTARAFERHRAAERVANHVSIGASCLGTVTAVFRYGVFFRLDEFKCPALLPREEITLDRSLDLDALYRQGQEVAVIVRAIQGDKVNLALPPTSRHGRGVR